MTGKLGQCFTQPHSIDFIAEDFTEFNKCELNDRGGQDAVHGAG